MTISQLSLVFVYVFLKVDYSYNFAQIVLKEQKEQSSN